MKIQNVNDGAFLYQVKYSFIDSASYLRTGVKISLLSSNISTKRIQYW